MKVIGPVTITDAMLVSSTAPEADFAAWAAATAYTVGNKAIRTTTTTHRIYQRLVAGTTATAPEADTVNWVDIGPTNRWAMLDSAISTATALASPLTVVLAPGYINGLALLGLVGSRVDVTVRDGAGGAVVYTTTVGIDAAVIADWYAYVWEPISQVTEVVLTDLPPYVNASVTVSIIGSTSVACGVLLLGTVYTLGDTQFNARLGITDYSRKETDAFGTTTFVKRKFSRRLTTDLQLRTSQLAAVRNRLEALRATPCVWIASDDTAYTPLIVFGFYRDFQITIAYPTLNFCSLEIEGLT